MEIKQIENMVEKINLFFSIISLIIFLPPFRSYKAVGLSLIIISTGLITKHFLNIFSSKKVMFKAQKGLFYYSIELNMPVSSFSSSCIEVFS